MAWQDSSNPSWDTRWSDQNVRVPRTALRRIAVFVDRYDRVGAISETREDEMCTCSMSPVLAVSLFVITLAAPAAADDEMARWRTLERQRDAYRSALRTVREEHGGVRRLPAVDFFLLGMGERAKFVYRGGRLTAR